MTNTYEWNLTPAEEQAVIKIKQALHRHPELSMKEVQTSKLIRTVLERMDGVRILDLPVETGVVALIRGGASGKLIALRADIDGIPKKEESQDENASQNEGVMHACGHDFHTASLLGAAQVLSRNRAELRGDVMLIFQPGEEITAGANALIQAGVFAEHKPSALFGMHNRPDIPVGQVVAETGYRMGGKYNFNIQVHGRASHGGSPQDARDPIVCACALVTAFQTIVSRNADPLKAMVLGIESIQSTPVTTTLHQMVDDVILEGSIRAHDDALRKSALERVQQICLMLAPAYGCEAVLEIEQEVPAVYNSLQMTKIAYAAAVQTVGEDHIISATPSLGCEDFAFFMQKVPSYYYWVGSGPSDPSDSAVYPGWHDPGFHTNDAGIAFAAKLFIESVREAQK